MVLATLVAQGLTLGPLVRLLGLDGDSGVAAELPRGRTELAEAALAALEGRSGPAADHWRHSFEAARDAASPSGKPAALDAKRALGLVALRRQRERLEQLRAVRQVGPEAFLILQEELDFLEVSLILATRGIAGSSRADRQNDPLIVVRCQQWAGAVLCRGSEGGGRVVYAFGGRPVPAKGWGRSASYRNARYPL